jgi:predicted nucleic acid-binding Zn ribbon protein
MAIQIPQHGHCTICGKAMPWSEKENYCSPECKAKLEELQKKRKRTLMFMYAMMGVSMIILLLYSLRIIK